MKDEGKYGISIEATSWRSQLVSAFALMAVVPLLTLGYYLLVYLRPNVVTRESVTLIVAFNIVLALSGFLILVKMIGSISKVSKYIETIARGDLSQSLSVCNGPDISTLGKSVELIVEKLVQDRDQLQTLSKDLQNAVERERLSALVQIASKVTNDFNNILMPIVGLSEYLVKHPDIADDKEDFLKIMGEIHSASLDARDIVKSLREEVRGREGCRVGDRVYQAIGMVTKWPLAP